MKRLFFLVFFFTVQPAFGQLNDFEGMWFDRIDAPAGAHDLALPANGGGPLAAMAPVHFTYSFSNLLDGGIDRHPSLVEFELVTAVEETLSLWSRHAPLFFEEQVDTGPAVSDRRYSKNDHADIRVGHHGISEANVLAHAFFPGSGGRNSDVHMNGNLNWREDVFYTTMIHELGHALGLNHSDAQTAIMNSQVSGSNTLPGVGRGNLFAPDVEAIQRVHGTGVGDVTTYRSFQGGVNADWSTHGNWNRGWRPTRHSIVSLGNDSQVHVNIGDFEVKSLELQGGRNTLQIQNDGALTVRQDLHLGVSEGGSPVISERSSVRSFVPTDGSLGDAWHVAEFDDSAWIVGTTGIGYERDSTYHEFIGTDLERQMFNRNSSVYSRIEFNVDDPTELDNLRLRMKYDDGFVAYLNGNRIAAGNAPGTLRWNSQANQSRSDSQALQFAEFPIQDVADLLVSGRNILAIQGLNRTQDSSDMLMVPVLDRPVVENRLVVEEGTLHVAGDLVLARDAISKTRTIIRQGTVVVEGHIQSGSGESIIEMHGGSLHVQGLTSPSSLLSGQSIATFLIPTDGSLGSDWTVADFDDTSWDTGSAAMGYERRSGFENEFTTDLSEMFNQSSSVYTRIKFDVNDLEDAKLLTLQMKYDDGFVAYLNGHKIESANVANDPVWNSIARESVQDNDALAFVDFDVSEFAHLLQENDNVLAIHGLNRGPDSSDFLIVPQLQARGIGGTLSVGTLDYHGGELLDVTTIDGKLRLIEGSFSPVAAGAKSGPGQLLVQGEFEQLETGTLAMDVAGTGSEDHDSLTIVGTAKLAGVLDIKMITGDDAYNVPTERGDFNELTLLAGTIEGSYSQISIDGEILEERHLGNGLFRDVLQTDNEVVFRDYLAITGDSNGDGVFGTNDLVAVLQAGEFEDGIDGLSDWTEGDWNLDGEFDSADFVHAFKFGAFEQQSVLSSQSVPETFPNGMLLLMALGSLCRLRYSNLAQRSVI